jgi:hypothetical protein
VGGAAERSSDTGLTTTVADLLQAGAASARLSATARRYDNLWLRLMANTADPDNEQSCWIWEAKRDRGGYGRVNVYVPGLGAVVILMSHIAAWCWLEARCESADDLYLAYLEFRSSGLELDHRCVTPCCIRPDHLLPITGPENRALRGRVRWGCLFT